MRLIKVNCGKYVRKYWKLTIHARNPRQLLSSKNLIKRVKSVLATLDTPAHIANAIFDGGIKLIRVDLARDFRADGVIEPTDEDRKEYRIKRMMDERDFKGTLYIQTEKRAVVECRYDKRKELLEVHKITRQLPISRIERRFHGARSCARHGVRTIPELCYYLRRMCARWQAEHAADVRSHLAAVRAHLEAHGEARGRAHTTEPYNIHPHPPRSSSQPLPRPAPRHPAEGRGGVPKATCVVHARGPPSPARSRTKNRIAKPRATPPRCCCAL